MKKGVLELCILHICSEQDRYGYEIMRLVTEAFPEINESTIYAVLRRLHADGCTESYTGSVSGGPQRKYYRITALGLTTMNQLKTEWLAFSKQLNLFLEGGTHDEQEGIS